MAPIGEAEIRSALAGAYGLQASAIKRLALGYDFNASVYRVTDQAGRSYFLKLRRDALYEPGIRIAEYLYSEGFREVVAPMHGVGARPGTGSTTQRCFFIRTLRGGPVWKLG
jgi:hypothetical protein